MSVMSSDMGNYSKLLAQLALCDVDLELLSHDLNVALHSEVHAG